MNLTTVIRIRDTFGAEVLQDIENRLKSKDFWFVSFDLEFTGLEPSESLRDICFDDEQLRHLKKKKTAEMYDVYQVGLTFVEKNQNKKTYEFYLMKDRNKSKCIKYVDNCCLKHMVHSGVDLNLVAEKGISYMNKKEFDLMVEEIEFSKQNKMDFPTDDKEFNLLCEKISSCLIESENLDQFEVVPRNDYLIKAIMQKYNDCVDWFVIKTKNDKNQKVVRFVKYDDMNDYTKVKMRELSNLCGFSQVIQLLIKYKSVMIGFSCMLDLYYIYSKFVDSIPEKVDDFKKELHKIFPVVYDIAYIIRNKDLKDKFESKSLGGVYDCMSRMKDSPLSGGVKQNVHTAGCDSYMTAMEAIWILWYRKIELKKLNSKNMLFNFRGRPFCIVPQDYKPKNKKRSDVFFIFADLTSVPRSKIIEPFKNVGNVKFVPNDNESCFIQIRDFDYYNYNWDEFIKSVLIKDKVLLWPNGRQHIIDELNKIKV
jgi:hypothetical protein